MATNEQQRAKELSSRDRGQLGNWLFTGYGDREEKTPIATSVPKVTGRGPKIGSQGSEASGAAPGVQPVHQRSGSAEARSYQARNRGNIGDIMGMVHEPAPGSEQPLSPTASRASTAVTEQSDAPSEAPSAKSSSSSEKASVVAASEVSDLPSPVESRADSVAASVPPLDVGDAPQTASPSRPRSVAEEYARRNKGTMDSTFGESNPRQATTPRVKGTDAQAYANRNRGQLTSDQYSYGQGKNEIVTSRPMSAKRQQDNMAGILGSGSGKDGTDSGPSVRSPRNAEARLYKDRNRGTMGDVLGGGAPWEMPKRSLAHDSYN